MREGAALVTSRRIRLNGAQHSGWGRGTRDDMTTWITICDTCKREGWEPGESGRTDGEALAELIEAAHRDADDGGKGGEGGAAPRLRTRRVSCLMGCKHGCNIAVQAKGKLTYTLGDFRPESEAAQAIVAYALLHAESDTGRVPYRSWPEPIKGHFVTRHPPLPGDE